MGYPHRSLWNNYNFASFFFGRGGGGWMQMLIHDLCCIWRNKDFMNSKIKEGWMISWFTTAKKKDGKSLLPKVKPPFLIPSKVLICLVSSLNSTSKLGTPICGVPGKQPAGVHFHKSSHASWISCLSLTSCQFPAEASPAVLDCFLFSYLLSKNIDFAYSAKVWLIYPHP